jgi:hypothetical protein
MRQAGTSIQRSAHVTLSQACPALDPVGPTTHPLGMKKQAMLQDV